MGDVDQLLPSVGVPRGVGVASNPPGATFGPRVLRDHEFVWMVEGGATYRRDGKSFDVPEGGVVLCRPCAEDGFDWDASRSSRHGFAHFDVLGVPPGFPAADEWPTVRADAAGGVWPALFRHVRSLDAAPPGSMRDALLAGALGHLLGAFVLGHLDAHALPRPDWPEPVRLAVDYLEAKLRRDPAAAVTLDELASAAFVTPAYLCRAFRRSAGVTPLEAVRRNRLDRALAMLTRSNASVANVAAACGFASPFHFGRRFKRAFGRPPGEVRSGARAGRTPPLPLGHARLPRPDEEGQSRA